MNTFRKFDPAFGRLDRAAHKRTTLVAGGAGFLGSNLCHRLIEQGDYVICVDNFSTGRMDNIRGLLTHPDFRCYSHDIIGDFEILGPLDRIYNMACAASPPKYQIDPIHTFKTSVFGGLNLLELAGRKDARILQSSTSEVYGNPDVSPQRESYVGLVNTVGPRSCYDEGKRAAETLFHDMHARDNIDVRIARIFNTYGPGMDPGDGRVVSNFIVQSLTGAPITVNGDGSQTRSFCYVDDMIDGLMALMEAEDGAGGVHDPVNLGNPVEFTMNELADLVESLTGSKAPRIYRALPQDDPLQRRPDISRAEELLNWVPKVDIVDGIELSIAYFRDQLQLGQNGRTVSA